MFFTSYDRQKGQTYLFIYFLFFVRGKLIVQKGNWKNLIFVPHTHLRGQSACHGGESHNPLVTHALPLEAHLQSLCAGWCPYAPCQRGYIYRWLRHHFCEQGLDIVVVKCVCSSCIPLVKNVLYVQYCASESWVHCQGIGWYGHDSEEKEKYMKSHRWIRIRQGWFL